MDKQIFLHIGRHKTGTSSIQYFLDRNTAYLAQQGYYFLDLGRGRKIANHNLATTLNPKFSAAGQMRDYRTTFLGELEARDEDKIIISSEGFQNIRDMSLLREFFKGFDLTVICYLREVLSYKQSAYCQSVHATGYYGRFADFASGYKLQYPRFVDEWSEVAGELIVALYQKSSLKDGDVVVDFMNRIGLDVSSDLSSLDTIHNNPSIGGNLLFFKLMLNLASEGNYEPRSHYTLLQSIARKESRYRGKFLVSDHDAEIVRRFDKPSNQFLRARFGELQLEDFSQFPPLPDRDTLPGDIEFFLEHPELAEVMSPLGFSAPGIMIP